MPFSKEAAALQPIASVIAAAIEALTTLPTPGIKVANYLPMYGINVTLIKFTTNLSLNLTS